MEPGTVLAIVIPISVILLLFAVYLFLIAPARKREGMEKFKTVKYAHRGLHTEGCPENSLAAFKRAVDFGFGIELDVRLTKDGELVVFHDDDLKRVCGAPDRVDEKTYAELLEYRLLGTEEKIPTFREVLDLVAGKVPLLVEIKEDAMKFGVSEKTAEILSEYSGGYIIESFNPLSLGRIKKLMPDVMRGLLSQNYLKSPKYRKPLYLLLQGMLFNCVARPDFIAFSEADRGLLPFKIVKAFFNPPTLAWTVKGEENEKSLLDGGFDGVIFEGYIPSDK